MVEITKRFSQRKAADSMPAPRITMRDDGRRNGSALGLSVAQPFHVPVSDGGASQSPSDSHLGNTVRKCAGSTSSALRTQRRFGRPGKRAWVITGKVGGPSWRSVNAISCHLLDMFHGENTAFLVGSEAALATPRSGQHTQQLRIVHARSGKHFPNAPANVAAATCLRGFP